MASRHLGMNRRPAARARADESAWPRDWPASTSTSPRVRDAVAVLDAERGGLDADRPHAALAAEQRRAGRRPPRGSCRCTAPSSTAAGCRRCGRRADRACSSVGRRDSSTRRASPSLRASASAHFSTSPGGRTPSSSRSCPELPPLSNIVTTAFSWSQGLVFSPPSRLGSPVPPPTQPTFSSRRCMLNCRSRSTVYGLRSTVSMTEAGRPRDWRPETDTMATWPLPGRQPRIRSPAIFAACSAIGFARSSTYGPHVEGDSTAPLTCLALVASLTADDLDACATLSRAGGGRTSPRRSSFPTPSSDGRSTRFRSSTAKSSARISSSTGTIRSSTSSSRRPTCAAPARRRSRVTWSTCARASSSRADDRAAVASLVAASAPAFTALLRNVARLNGVHTTDRGEATRHGAQAVRIPEQLVSDLLSLEHSIRHHRRRFGSPVSPVPRRRRTPRACGRYLARVATSALRIRPRRVGCSCLSVLLVRRRLMGAAGAAGAHAAGQRLRQRDRSRQRASVGIADPRAAGDDRRRRRGRDHRLARGRRRR